MADKGKEQEEKPELSTSAFEALERDFQEVIASLVGDKSLEKFRTEYEKLHRALKRSHDHERKLIKKVRELNTEIVNNASKVHTALKLSQEDQSTIDTLRKNIEKAWKLVDVSQEKEKMAKQTIDSLKEEISKLSQIVETANKMSSSQETMVKELIKTREELQRQAEDQKHTEEVMHGQLQNMDKQNEELSGKAKAQNDEINSLKETLTTKNSEMERQARRLERMDEELKVTRNDLDNKTEEQTATKEEVETTQGKVGALDKQLRATRTTMEKMHRDYDELLRRTQKLTDDLEEQMRKNQQLNVENINMNKDNNGKHEEIVHLRTEMGQMERNISKSHLKIVSLEQKLVEAKTPLIVAQKEKVLLEKDMKQLKTLAATTSRDKETAEQEKNVQVKKTKVALEKKNDADSLIMHHESVITALENELNGQKSENLKQEKQLYELNKQREEAGLKISEQTSLYMDAMEQNRLKDDQAKEFERNIHEWENKVKQQQQLYDQLRSDRNTISKNLVDSQDEIAEIKRKSKIMSHQIAQLKEEISEKDKALVKISYDGQKMDKHCEQSRHENSRMRALIETSDGVINKQDAEIARLAGMTRRMDEDALAQRKEYDQIINERDILGTQLIRRNDELALLYEKLKIQHSTLRKGEIQYTARVQDIRVLRLKVRDIQRQLRIAESSRSRVSDQKRELIALNRELLQEKTKVKALSEELENPMNLHRWRKLEGSDPTTYEMIQKIQTLQKRLIGKTEEVVEKELTIQEKEKLCTELQNILARQPGPEVAEQMSVFQSSLRNKTKQMKSMASELNMSQAQVNESKYEVERLTRELQNVKRKYYAQKRRDQLENEMSMGEDPEGQALQQMKMAEKATTRFVGGGFAIK